MVVAKQKLLIKSSDVSTEKSSDVVALEEEKEKEEDKNKNNKKKKKYLAIQFWIAKSIL